jgi:hypothetical protein
MSQVLLHEYLAEEIAPRFKKDYPKDNIVFSDEATASLWQAGNEVMRCDMTDTAHLEKLPRLYFSFERPELAGLYQQDSIFPVEGSRSTAASSTHNPTRRSRSWFAR